MNLQVVYCNHLTAGLNIREKLAFSVDRMRHAYSELQTRFPKTEAVVLSTCNRVEVYTAHESDQNAPTHSDLTRFFSEFHQVPESEFASDLLEQTGPAAVEHLFQVASSIDSMVLGEPQIVAQVKEAYQLAQQHDACGPLTHALFQGAIRVSSRVRTETKLTEGRVSIASVAVGEFGKSIFDRFDDKTVLIIGAGEMAEETLTYLRNEGVGRTLIVNRSVENALALAAKFPGSETESFADLDKWLSQADVIVSTTGATQPVVSVDRFRQARASSRPVFILDLGAPRDFEPGVNEIDDNVFLYDIDDLEATCERNRQQRQKEVNQARQIIGEETDRFMHDIYHRATGPIVKRLREQWHDISRDELDLLNRKLAHLSDADRESVERSVHRIVNKLLHPPLEALRSEAKGGAPHGLLDALKRLFHISE